MIARSSRVLVRGSRLGLQRTALHGLVPVLLALFYLATAPHNHTESMDGYRYAAAIAAEPLSAAPYPRQLLYIAGMRCLYVMGAALVPALDAYALLVAASAISAALSVTLVAHLLRRAFGLGQLGAWLGAGLLGGSYGFWRYAGEAEVYVPAMLVLLAVLALLFRAEDRGADTRWPAVLPAACLAGLGVLFYQPVAVLAGLAIPLYLIGRGRLSWLAAYLAVLGLLVAGGYLVAFALTRGDPLSLDALQAFVFDRFDEFQYDPPSVAMALKVGLALGHDVVATNWVYGIEPLRALAQHAVPHWIFDEEIFAASRAGYLVWVPLVTLPAFAVGLIWSVLVALRAPAPGTIGRRGLMVLIWLAAHAVLMAWLSPAGYEAWTMALPPLAILLALVVLEPSIRARRLLPPALLLVSLITHNALAGIGIVFSEASDQHRTRSGWLLHEAREQDLVVVAVNERLEAFLRHHLPARVARLDQDGPAAVRALIGTALDAGGRVFVFDEFFAPPPAFAARVPDDVAAAGALAEELRKRAQPVFESQAGTTYELR